MRTSNLITTLASILMITGFIGCSDDSGNPAGKTADHADTSIFIGTWVTVFDTSDNPPGTKEQKLEMWCRDGECYEQDTFEFLNDSIFSGYESGLEKIYYYSEDSIYYYLPIIGTNEKEHNGTHAYFLKNDTLLFDFDSTKYRPVNIRITKIPINKWNK